MIKLRIARLSESEKSSIFTLRARFVQERARDTHIVPVAGPATVQVVLTALVPIDNLLFVIDLFSVGERLLLQRVGDLRAWKVRNISECDLFLIAAV